MSVEIRPIPLTNSALRKFVDFGIKLYKGNSCFVPPLITDEINTLRPDKNPAFEFCRAQAYMAFVDGRPAGRIVAIINDVVNHRTGVKQARFGFVDFIDDRQVSAALFAAAEQWAVEQGMTEIIGPMGFTDMDHEGMLIDGFNEMGTMATIYNHPYYPAHIEELGYKPDVDWVEYRVKVPVTVPDKMDRIANIIKQKYGLRSVTFTSRKLLKEKYGHALFHLINEAYDNLYGYSPLTDRQIDHYIDEYLGIIRLDCISVIVDENDNLVAAGITMPSLSQALRKSGGKFFPFGWYHLLRALNGGTEVIDLLLIAVRKDLMSRGVNSLIFQQLIPIYNKVGFKECESNIELESNDAVRLQWQYFEHRQHRRRRAYKKIL